MGYLIRSAYLEKLSHVYVEHVAILTFAEIHHSGLPFIHSTAASFKEL